MTGFDRHPDGPYYAVIFTTKRTGGGDREYGEMAEAMARLSEKQPGYLGIESVRGEDGLGITVSYWRDQASIKAWKALAEHLIARKSAPEGGIRGIILEMPRWKGGIPLKKKPPILN